MFAAAAMACSSISVVCSSLLLQTYKPIVNISDSKNQRGVTVTQVSCSIDSDVV